MWKELGGDKAVKEVERKREVEKKKITVEINNNHQQTNR
jgi:hypothetical protein